MTVEAYTSLARLVRTAGREIRISIITDERGPRVDLRAWHGAPSYGLHPGSGVSLRPCELVAARDALNRAIEILELDNVVQLDHARTTTPGPNAKGA